MYLPDALIAAAPQTPRLRERVRRFLVRQSKGWLITDAAILVFAIGCVDYITGYEVTIFPFYSIAILLALWLAGTGAAVFISVLSALVGWWVDRTTGHVYSREWLRVWDSLVRLTFFYLVVLAGTNVRRQRDENRARIELLERSQKLEQEIINISESEQRRIGHDLHDSLGQHLVAVGLAAESLKDELLPQTPRAAKAVGQFAELLHDAVNLARDLARGLSPVDRDEGGLESALEQLATHVSSLSGVACTFRSEGVWSLDDHSKAVHVYRIAQEASNNAIKHAMATSVSIAIVGDGERVRLTISDDGVGFAPSASLTKGMGLNIMRYRSRMLGGTLTVRGRDPSGTVVECSMGPGAEADEGGDPS